MKRPRILALLMLAAIILGSLSGCQRPPVQSLAQESPSASSSTPAPALVYFPGESWQASTPEAQGMDSARLAAMLEYVQAQNIRLHSLLIVRNGSLVLEAYFNPYEKAAVHQIASVTKSVVGALVGIAIEQGKIKSLQQPVLDFFPDRQVANQDERKRGMTLEHLLMLAPGLECDDAKGTEALMTQSQDWVQFVLDLPVSARPGEKWAYCSSAVHLISAILQKATGMDARTYANRFLFKPIGIADVPPERWPSDPSGVSMGGAGLMLTPLEMARFAYLYLNQGRWGDRQVVPEQWVAGSTSAHIGVGKLKAYGDMERSYGYLWSIYPERKFYSALGRNGQHLHIFPAEDLVVVFTSATSLFSDEHQFELLKEYILPSIRSKTALPENSAGTSKLAALIAEAAAPRRPVGNIPVAGQKLNRKQVRIEENPFGWETITFNFEEGEDEAVIQFNHSNRLLVGLDNLYRVQDMPGLGKVGFRGAWEREDRFTIQQVVLGGWNEFEISLTVDGEKVNIFQRNAVDGGNLVRVVGEIEE